ncbi:MAG: BMP family ABC transporter substrate-binding protein, partial [Thermosphaera sp.]
MKTNILIGIFIVLIIISGAIGYIVGQQTGAPVQQYTPPEKIKAAWIYVGPIGDAGWTFMHDIGRKYVETVFDEWLDTT